jgi:hypothetical protein
VFRVVGGEPLSMRSTWKKQLGTATVSMNGPPVLNTPLLVANSVCPSENVGPGIR